MKGASGDAHLLDHAISRILESESPWHWYGSGLCVDDVEIDAGKRNIV